MKTVFYHELSSYYYSKNRNTIENVMICENEYDMMNDNVFEYLSKFKNIQFLEIETDESYYTHKTIKDEWLQPNSFNNRIALLQKLSNVFIRYDGICVDLASYVVNQLHYIFNEFMIIFYYNEKTVIDENIKYLNIINVNNFNILNDLPLDLKKLHVSIFNTHSNKINITNLPLSLKKLSITCIHHFKKIDESKIKLPFGCKLEIKYI